MMRLRRSLLILLLLFVASKAFAMSTELELLLNDALGEMRVISQEITLRQDICAPAMWDRSRELVRRAIADSVALFQIDVIGDNPEVVEKSYNTRKGCQDRVRISWHKPTDADPNSYIDVTVNVNCTCNPGAGTDVDEGELSYRIPVRVRRFLGTVNYVGEKPGGYRMNLKCCGNPRQQYRAYDSDGRRTAIAQPLTAEQLAQQTADRQAQQEQATREREQRQQQQQEARDRQQREREVKQREDEYRRELQEKQREYQRRICSECESIYQVIQDKESERAAKEQEKENLQRELERKRAEIRETEKRIRRTQLTLNNLGGGASASSYDPYSGERIESIENTDGSVTVTTYDRNGRQLDQYTRDPKKKRQRREELQQELQNAEAERDRLRDEARDLAINIQRAHNWIRYLDGEIAHLYQRLRDCLRRCRSAGDSLPPHLALPVPEYRIPSQEELDKMAGRKPRLQLVKPGKTESVQPADQPVGALQRGATGATCNATETAKPILIGKTSEFKGVGKTVEKVAKGVAQKALGNLFGGSGFSFGGGGGNDMADSPASRKGPDTVPDPVKFKDKKIFSDAKTGLKVAVGAKVTDAGVIYSAELVDPPARNTFHTMQVQDRNCHWRYALSRYIYELWLDWNLHIWWTHDTYHNDQLVKHEEGESFSAGSEMLGSGTIYADKTGQAVPFWQGAGFPTPFDGARAVGALFDTSNSDETLAVYVTHEQGDEFWAVPILMNIFNIGEGEVALKPYSEKPAAPVQLTQQVAGGAVIQQQQQDQEPVQDDDLGLSRLRGGFLYNPYSISVNPHQSAADRAATESYNRGYGPKFERLNAAADAAAQVGRENKQNPVDVGRLAGNAVIKIRTKPKNGVPARNPVRLDEALHVAAEQAQKAGGTPQQIGLAAGLTLFEDDMDWDEEYDLPPRRFRLNLPSDGSLVYANPAAQAAATTLLGSGGDPRQAGAAIGAAIKATNRGGRALDQAQDDKPTDELRIELGSPQLWGANDGAAAAEQTKKILGDWYKEKNRTLSPTDLGTAVGEAVQTAGGSKADAAKHAAEATIGAGGTAAEAEAVRAGIILTD